MFHAIALGVGPFCVVRPPNSSRVFKASHGFAIEEDGSQSTFVAATNPALEIALAQVADNAQIELILQRDFDLNSVYRSVYPGMDDGGFHHACIISSQIETDLRRLFDMNVRSGLQLDLLITDLIGKVMYFDARQVASLGCHFEITQETKFPKTVAPVYKAIHHLGKVFGPFGRTMASSTIFANLFIDRAKLGDTNILFEASSFAQLGAKAIFLATKTGWIPI